MSRKKNKVMSLMRSARKSLKKGNKATNQIQELKLKDKK